MNTTNPETDSETLLDALCRANRQRNRLAGELFSIGDRIEEYIKQINLKKNSLTTLLNSEGVSLQKLESIRHQLTLLKSMVEELRVEEKEIRTEWEGAVKGANILQEEIKLRMEIE